MPTTTTTTIAMTWMETRNKVQLLSPLWIDDIYASLPSVRFVTVYMAKHTHTSQSQSSLQKQQHENTLKIS